MNLYIPLFEPIVSGLQCKLCKQEIRAVPFKILYEFFQSSSNFYFCEIRILCLLQKKMLKRIFSKDLCLLQQVILLELTQIVCHKGNSFFATVMR